jgi:hypothetical protein
VTAAADLRPMAGAVARALFRATDPDEFRPEEDWHDLGMLIEALEIRGFCLLLNSAFRDGRIRRMASLHKESERASRGSRASAARNGASSTVWAKPCCAPPTRR